MRLSDRFRRVSQQVRVQTAPQPTTAYDADVAEMLGEAGSALLRASRATSAVELVLRDLARAYGRPDIRSFVLPTLVMVDDPRAGGERTALFPATGAALRLDQAGDVEQVVADATDQRRAPTEIIARLRRIETSPPRYNNLVRLIGHVILTVGFGLVLDPIASALPVYAGLGLLVGLVVVFSPRVPTLVLILPIATAFVITSLVVLVLAPLVGDDPIRLVTPALVSLLPGLTLTLAAVELTNNQVVAGASRLIYGAAQLGLLGFGLFAAITIFGEPPAPTAQTQLGWWAPWLGVALTALGYALFSVAPRGAFPWILLSLVVAYGAQLGGSRIVGAQLSGFVGAFVVIVVVALLRRIPAAPPSAVMLTCAYWLLVPGALGFIGLSRVAEGAGGGADLLLETMMSLLAIAIGMVVGAGITRDAGTALRAWRSGDRAHAADADAPPRAERAPLGASPASTGGTEATRSIRVSAAVITDIADGRERLLLVRKAGTTAFMQPGGKPEAGESPAQTLVRELAEELGLRLDLDALAPLGEFTANAANEPGFLVVADVFRVDIGDQTPAPDAEIAELRWVTRAEASTIEVAPLAAAYFLPRP